MILPDKISDAFLEQILNAAKKTKHPLPWGISNQQFGDKGCDICTGDGLYIKSIVHVPDEQDFWFVRYMTAYGVEIIEELLRCHKEMGIYKEVKNEKSLL